MAVIFPTAMVILEALVGTATAKNTVRDGPGDAEFEKMLSVLSVVNPISYAVTSFFFHAEKARMIENGEEVSSMAPRGSRKHGANIF